MGFKKKKRRLLRGVGTRWRDRLEENGDLSILRRGVVIERLTWVAVPDCKGSGEWVDASGHCYPLQYVGSVHHHYRVFNADTQGEEEE